MNASFVGHPAPNRLRGVSRIASDISTGVFGHSAEQSQPTIGPIEHMTGIPTQDSPRASRHGNRLSRGPPAVNNDSRPLYFVLIATSRHRRGWSRARPGAEYCQERAEFQA